MYCLQEKNISIKNGGPPGRIFTLLNPQGGIPAKLWFGGSPPGKAEIIRLQGDSGYCFMLFFKFSTSFLIGSPVGDVAWGLSLTSSSHV